uniref:Uncharacterized protein n=1 Tax=Vespula pensylvanica TaxID=30213 RepID=A0A834PC87_VESPE|nr:hypothetical protein H0235_003657 [Vespula pensylvanica]
MVITDFVRKAKWTIRTLVVRVYNIGECPFKGDSPWNGLKESGVRSTRMVAVEPYLSHLVLVSAFRTPFFEPSRAGAFEIPTARAVVLVSKSAS